ncbi:hypothetical protein [Bartonella koehlerae]|uniref:Uncharacterized protein n=1 Tax=Bartonella koehlerae C-29 TaxID=1134510 RepID=A0A067W4M4_9HYPH|nr:hypothetical protein O9A_01293 [Bartonella koehlerae C-29]
MTRFFSYFPKNAVTRWFDKRLPLPRNLNYFYTFGGILTVMLLS